MRPMRSDEQNAAVIWAHAAIGALVDAGLRDVVVSPGSRSTPLVAAVCDDPRVHDHSVIDERSAAFVALGMAQASGRPVALVCTSGTALANYLPAVCEANHAQVPLILLTADRPPRLRDSGASQAMRQVDLYGAHVRWSHDLGMPSEEPEELRYVRSIARRAFAISRDEKGPVHLNFPFDKPLEPTGRGMTVASGPMVFDNTIGPVYQPVAKAPDPHAMTEVVRLVESASRPVIVVGSSRTAARWGRVLDEVARRIGAPIIAEATSQLRFGELHDAVVAGDVLLSSPELAGTLRPDLLLRLGSPSINWPVLRWVSQLDATRIIVSDHYDCDPDANADMIFVADECAFLDALRRRLPDSDVPSSWRRQFTDHGQRATEYIRECMNDAPLVDAVVAHDLARLMPEDGALFVSSSMPLRELESFALARPERLTVYANRGLNGIDGVVSSAYGVAAKHDGPTALLIGDVAMAHDLAALQLNKRLDVPLTIVVVDNGGGAIFDHLPVAGMEPMFTRHFTTETGLHWEGADTLFGIEVTAVTDRGQFAAAIESSFERPGTKVVVVRTVREEAQSFRQRILTGFRS